MSDDLIKRSDAIAELWDMTTEDCPNPGAAVGKCMEAIRHLPSADIPTVIRVKSIMKKEDYKILADSIRQQAPTAIVIPHNAELVTPADRPQGEWIDIGGYEVCKNCHEVKRFPHWTFCPNCGARMRPKLQGKHFDSIIIDECALKGADDDSYYKHD